MVDIELSADDEEEAGDRDEIFEIFDEDERAIETAIHISLWLRAFGG